MGRVCDRYFWWIWCPFGNLRRRCFAIYRQRDHSEGDSGGTTYTFTVSLSGPAPAGGVSYNIATQDDSATLADNDYQPLNLVGESIPEASQSKTYNVTVNGDINFEPNETFFVNVTSVVRRYSCGWPGIRNHH